MGLVPYGFAHCLVDLNGSLVTYSLFFISRWEFTTSTVGITLKLSFDLLARNSGKEIKSSPVKLKLPS